MDGKILIGLAAAGAVIAAGSKKGSGSSGSSGGGNPQRVSPEATLLNPLQAIGSLGIPEDDWPEMVKDVPFAAGIKSPIWPIQTSHPDRYVVSYPTIRGKWIGSLSRSFLSNRSGGRYHAGVDLYGYDGDLILAMEDGVIVNHYHFYHDTYALFVQCKSGLVINYSEVTNNSWQEFGLKKGSEVKRGKPIARVGLMSGGSHMCHFETYMPPTKSNKRYTNSKKPAVLTNPTYYLLNARGVSTGSRSYSATACEIDFTFGTDVPQDLVPIADEEIKDKVPPGDSVLREMLYSGEGSGGTADGP